MNLSLHIFLAASSLLVSACSPPENRSRPPHTLTNSLGMELIYVPPGRFVMGSPPNAPMSDPDEKPARQVRITQAFYLARTEVTKSQFAAFVRDALWQTEAEREGWSYAWRNGSFQMVSGVSFRNTGFPQTDRHPVVCVSWQDAVEFCRWLGHKEGRRYRLPTEAEWEYACRAGRQTTYHWGDRPQDGAGWCNVADLTARDEFSGTASPSRLFPWHDRYVFTAPVGSFRANAFGLYDMHGNVLEFCSDWYGQAYYAAAPAVDPQGMPTGQFRALRGGDWSSYPPGCRSAKRYRDRPSIRCTNLGFRVALAPNALTAGR